MSGKFLARASALSLAVFLAACGGDDGGSSLSGLPGDNPPEENTGGGTGSTPDSGAETPAPEEGPVVSSLQLISSQPSIGTSGSETATITAIVKDEDSILIEGAEVKFRIPANNGTLISPQTTTSEQGAASVNVSAAGDYRNRTISVEATAGELSETINIEAQGTRILITGPSNIAQGDTASYTLTLSDSDGRGIPSEEVEFSAGANSVNAPATTNLSGQIPIDVTATTGGDSKLVATTLDGTLQAERPFTVSSESFTFESPAAGTEVNLNEPLPIKIKWEQGGNPVDGENVLLTTEKGTFSSGTNTTTVTVSGGSATANLSSNQSGKSLIQATTEDSGLTTSMEVEFIATEPAALKLNASKTQMLVGESSDISVVVRDANGNLVKNANVTFGLSDTTGGRLTTLSDTTDSLGTARTSFISGGTASEKDGIKVTASVDAGVRGDQTDDITSEIPLTVGGQALTIIIGTGNTLNSEGQTFYDQPWGIQVTDANGNAVGNQRVELSVLPAEYRKGFYVDMDPEPDAYDWQPTYEAFCTPENAIPAGSDRSIANPASTPSSIFTDANGKFEFGVEYTKAQCNWAKVKLTATAEVDGKESTSTQTFTLPCLSDDLKSSMPPGGIDSFYGASNDCATID